MARLSAWIALFMLLCAACSTVPSNRPGAAEPPMSDQNWSLRLIQSGGFTGRAREFFLEGATGHITIKDDVRSSTTSRALAPSETRAIALLIAAAPEANIDRVSETCADCFVYELQVTRKDLPHSARYDSLTLPGSPHEPLISSVIALEQHRTGP